MLDHHSEQEHHQQAEMLRHLPRTIAVCIALEIHSELLVQIPFLEPLLDKLPLFTQEICLAIEKRTVPYNNFLFEQGIDGIYWIKEGCVALEGVVYTSGSVLGLACQRSNPKPVECRALTDVNLQFLAATDLKTILKSYPKAEKYIRRWTCWQLTRDYILNYSRLYYRAIKRGALMIPPLLSKRPTLKEGEFDDIDIAVLDHIAQNGY